MDSSSNSLKRSTSKKFVTASRVFVFTDKASKTDCDEAKKILEAHQAEVSEIKIDGRAWLKDEMIKLSGVATTPQIYILDKYIGDLAALKDHEANKELDNQIAAAKNAASEPKLAKLYADQRNVFEISPKQLFFPPIQSATPRPIICILKLTNKTDKGAVWRMRLKSPEKYNVKPSKGCIAPSESETIEVTLTNGPANPSEVFRIESILLNSMKEEYKQKTVIDRFFNEYKTMIQKTEFEAVAAQPPDNFKVVQFADKIVIEELQKTSNADEDFLTKEKVIPTPAPKPIEVQVVTKPVVEATPEKPKTPVSEQPATIADSFTNANSTQEQPKPVEKPVERASPVEVRPAEVKPAEVKPVEVKPVVEESPIVKPAVEQQPTVSPAKPAVEVKPVDTKPVEIKPTEVKPVEKQPQELKPVVSPTKPVEQQPVSPAKPAVEVKPVDSKPVEVKPVAEVKPVEVKPVEVKPVEKPVEVKPVVKPVEQQPNTPVKPTTPVTTTPALESKFDTVKPQEQQQQPAEPVTPTKKVVQIVEPPVQNTTPATESKINPRPVKIVRKDAATSSPQQQQTASEQETMAELTNNAKAAASQLAASRNETKAQLEAIDKNEHAKLLKEMNDLTKKFAETTQAHVTERDGLRRQLDIKDKQIVELEKTLKAIKAEQPELRKRVAETKQGSTTTTTATKTSDEPLPDSFSLLFVIVIAIIFFLLGRLV